MWFKEIYEKICEAFRPVAQEHINVYGAFNERLPAYTKQRLLMISAMAYQTEVLQ